MLFDSQLIVWKKNFPDCEAAIRYGGSILYRLGYVKDTYTDSVLAREKLFPTGLPTQPVPIAIPHTGSEHVNKSMFCMIVFDQPVMFRQMGSEEERIPAEIMMLLAIDGSERHLEFLSDILGIFSDGSVLTRIRAAGSAEEICSILGEFEQLQFD